MYIDSNFTIRENLDGKYIIIHANQLKEGIVYAEKIKIHQIQLRGVLGDNCADMVVDFSNFEKLTGTLKIISFADEIDGIINFESIYLLENIEKINIQHKQNFNIDVSSFPKLKHLGSECWNGLKNINNASGLVSLVIYKYAEINLENISNLKKLQLLHIYSSKIKTLNGIEELPIKELFLVKNNYLEKLNDIQKMKSLKILHIEKCKKIINFSFLENNKTIESLFISDVDSFNFIPSMKNINALRFWNLQDGDLNYLLSSATLKYVDFHPQKKNYTHKKEEVNKLIN
ncbi:toxin [Escherichia coli]|nr:toxin [Escherichia coli]